MHLTQNGDLWLHPADGDARRLADADLLMVAQLQVRDVGNGCLAVWQMSVDRELSRRGLVGEFCRLIHEGAMAERRGA